MTFELSADILAPIIIGASTGIGGWVYRVETRFAAQAELMKKLDHLITLMLEEKLNGSNHDQIRGGTKEPLDPSGNIPHQSAG